MRTLSSPVHRYITVDDTQLFYREAGPENAPVLLLLHGFPSSSVQFRHLFSRLADRRRLVAPDFPGFGFSAVPDHRHFAYTFEHFAEVIGRFIQTMQIEPRAVYLHDYGAQAGYRLLANGTVRPAAVIIQNSEAYFEPGRTDAWSAAETYWRDPSAGNRESMRASLLNESGIRREFVENLPAHIVERIDPSVIRLACDHIRRPGVAEAMLDLHRDYSSNVAFYPQVQAWLRQSRVPTQVLWGKGDQYYGPEQAEAFRRDVEDITIDYFDGGHWLVETHPEHIAEAVHGFLQRNVPS
jgi:pimeloyl-ACP methyl ester carboxylesterase